MYLLNIFYLYCIQARATAEADAAECNLEIVSDYMLMSKRYTDTERPRERERKLNFNVENIRFKCSGLLYHLIRIYMYSSNNNKCFMGMCFSE